MIQQNYFYIKQLTNDIDGGKFYKIVDKQTRRQCFATPKMLNQVLEMLVACIENGYYEKQNNHSLDFKVYSMFLNKKVSEQKYKEYRELKKLRKLPHHIKNTIDWKLINYYLLKRKESLVGDDSCQ